MEKLNSSITLSIFGKRRIPFYVFLVPFIFLLALSISFYVSLEMSSERAAIVDRENNVIELLSSNLSNEFSGALESLNFISRQPELENAINDTNSYLELEELYEQYINEHPSVSRFRLTDTSGNDLLIVESLAASSNAEEVSQPTNILNSYFFDVANKLPPGAIYVSKMDLAVNDNELVNPYQPTLRFSTPVFDNQGQRFAVLTLSYRAEEVLNLFDTVSRSTLSETFLLNKDGFYLSSPITSDEWGFMLTDSQKKNLPEIDQTLWNIVNDNYTGSFVYKNDLYIFRFICGEDSCAKYSNSPRLVSFVPYNAQDLPWVILSKVPYESFSFVALISKNISTYALILSVSSALSIASAFFLWKLSQTIYLLTKSKDVADKYSKKAFDTEAQFDKFIDILPDALFLVDDEGKIRQFNEKALDLFCYSSEEFFDMKIDQLVPKTVQAAHPKLRMSFSQNPTKRSMSGKLNLQALKSTGELFPVDVALTPFSIKGRNMVACIVKDMTSVYTQIDVLNRKSKALEILNNSLKEKYIRLKKKITVDLET